MKGRGGGGWGSIEASSEPRHTCAKERFQEEVGWGYEGTQQRRG